MILTGLLIAQLLAPGAAVYPSPAPIQFTTAPGQCVIATPCPEGGGCVILRPCPVPPIVDKPVDPGYFPPTVTPPIAQTPPIVIQCPPVATPMPARVRPAPAPAK